MPEPIRTWTLALDTGDPEVVDPEVAREVSDGEFCEVVELGPVLGFLERAYDALSQITHWSGHGPHSIATPWADEVAPFLREHGRLS